MSQRKSVRRIKDDCWIVTYLKKCRLNVSYFLTKDDPSQQSLEEIMQHPHVDGEGLTYKDALHILRTGSIPKTHRQQKKRFKEVVYDLTHSDEEHF